MTSHGGDCASRPPPGGAASSRCWSTGSPRRWWSSPSSAPTRTASRAARAASSSSAVYVARVGPLHLAARPAPSASSPPACASCRPTAVAPDQPAALLLRAGAGRPGHPAAGLPARRPRPPRPGRRHRDRHQGHLRVVDTDMTHLNRRLAARAPGARRSLCAPGAAGGARPDTNTYLLTDLEGGRCRRSRRPAPVETRGTVPTKTDGADATDPGAGRCTGDPASNGVAAIGDLDTVHVSGGDENPPPVLEADHPSADGDDFDRHPEPRTGQPTSIRRVDDTFYADTSDGARSSSTPASPRRLHGRAALVPALLCLEPARPTCERPRGAQEVTEGGPTDIDGVAVTSYRSRSTSRSAAALPDRPGRRPGDGRGDAVTRRGRPAGALDFDLGPQLAASATPTGASPSTSRRPRVARHPAAGGGLLDGTRGFEALPGGPRTSTSGGGGGRGVRSARRIQPASATPVLLSCSEQLSRLRGPASLFRAVV